MTEGSESGNLEEPPLEWKRELVGSLSAGTKW